MSNSDIRLKTDTLKWVWAGGYTQVRAKAKRISGNGGFLYEINVLRSLQSLKKKVEFPTDLLLLTSTAEGSMFMINQLL